MSIYMGDFSSWLGAAGLATPKLSPLVDVRSRTERTHHDSKRLLKLERHRKKTGEWIPASAAAAAAAAL